MDSKQALQKLIVGNKAYVENQNAGVDKHPFIAEQRPFAIVLGCSDSRAPVETIFDQTVGDLFIVRVAGNIATPTQIGSIEFACQNFGSPLIVVMGHTGCGAIKATIGCIESGTEGLSENLASIVDPLLPVVKQVAACSDDSSSDLVLASTQANIKHTIEQLKQQSPVLSELCEQGELDIVGALFSIETGKVTFYD